MSRVNVLTLERRTERRRPHLVAAEFLVDGRSLLEHCERATGETFDVFSPFGWTSPDYQLALAEGLLLRRPSLLPSGRQVFLVCPECGDLGCGCISARVESENDCFIWRDFGCENNYNLDSLRLFPMGKVVIHAEVLTRLLRGHVQGL